MPPVRHLLVCRGSYTEDVFRAYPTFRMSIPTAALAGAAPDHFRGYHLLMDEPVKEAVWEAVNRDILNKAGCPVTSTADGSHTSGADIQCSLGALSNKSVKYEKGGAIAISSYRLTTVCSDAAPGTPAEISAEIERRKNFQFYSLLARTETAAAITYDWYLVPAGHPLVNPATYTWRPLVGSRGAKKGKQIGWTTDPLPSAPGAEMSITFSMSSQLWISIPSARTTLADHLICSVTVARGRKLDYADLWKTVGAKA